MVRKYKVKIVLILVFFLGAIVFGQDKQVKENKQLREDILTAYQSGGKQGLLDFVKKKKDKISSKFIKDFANAGRKERKEEWLTVCEIIAKEKKDEKTLASVLYNTGRYFKYITDFKKATAYFDKTIPIYLKLNDLVGQGNVYGNKGDIYLRFGDNSRALEMYDKALTFFEKAGYPLGQGNVYDAKGIIYNYTGENSEALEMYDKALTFYEKAGSLVGQGNEYRNKAEIYSEIGDKSRALEMYDKALTFFEKAGEPIGQGNVYADKGTIYLTIGDKTKAFEMFDKALPFFEKAGQLIGQGYVYINKGKFYLYINDYPRALEMFDKALTFYKKAGSLLGQGNVFRSMGEFYLDIDDNSKAFEMFDKALTFYEKVGNPIGLGNAYHGKGIIYDGIGDDSKALEMYDKALPFFEKSGQPLGQGNVYLAKGIIYLNTGDNSRAFEMFDKALTFYEKVGYPLGQGNVYELKGRIYLRVGDNTKTLEMLDKALTFFEKVGNLNGQGSVYFFKGDMYLKTGDNSRALEMINKALFFFEKEGALTNKSIALHVKATILEELGKKDEALDLFEKGIANLEKVRTQTAFSEMKKTYMERVYRYYEETVLYMLENKYENKGFKYAESMRTRVFLDQMAEGLVRLDKGLIPELKQNRDKLVAKLSLLSKQMHQTAGKKEEKKLLELKEQYRKTESEFEDLLVKIRLNNPLYASVRYPQPITVRVLQKEVLKKGELLLRYFISPDKLYVFIISKDNFKVKRLKVKEKEIKSLVKRCLLTVEENNSRGIKRYGKTLYKKLFKPLEKTIKGNKDIIIIPDGELTKIPFESLIIDEEKSGRPVYLMEKYRLKYIQSASLLSVLRKHYHPDKETNSFIGFGDPVYDYENFKQGKPEQGSMKIFATESTEVTENSPLTYSPHSPHSPNSPGDEIRGIHRSRYARAGGIMNRLPRSGEEVNSIGQLFKKSAQKWVVHSRDQASEDKAKALEMKDFDYIHFACHGLLNDDFQSLVLSQLPPEKSPEDGYFTLNEIMNCDYNAKLVVLSACQTGTGKMERAEGITGLTRAVMYAGTPAVVASLWKVDDKATKELMVRFYKNILEKNLSKAEALRQAKLELLKTQKYSSPLFWSAFVLYGE